MNTRTFDEGSRLVGATSWAAIASGVVIALAVQIVFLMFGLAFGLSVGDRVVAGGYALWAVLVQLVSIALGAALAARISRASRPAAGAAVGVMTWAVSLVLGGAMAGLTTMPQAERTGAWAAFFGALLALGAGILGGAAGAMVGRAKQPPVTTEPMAPTQTQPI